MAPDILLKARRAALRAFPTIPEMRTVHKTSFLDGLRGVAAVVVTINHHCMGRKRYFQEPFTLGPYGVGDNAIDFTNPFQLPILRIAYTGGSMVPIFFVISGYVLSFRQVKMIREGNMEKIGESLFSLAFRRPFRLFLPTLGAFILYQVEREFEPQQANAQKKPWIVYRILWQIAVLFQGIWGANQRNLWMEIQQLWTIPLEYFGSMVVFMMLLTNARLKYSWRKTFIVTSIPMAFYTGHWEVGTFLGGMLIAELEAQKQEESDLDFESKGRKAVAVVQSSLFNIYWFMTLIMGLFLAGWPEAKFNNDPVLSKLLPITPKHLDKDFKGSKWFWLGISGIQIVWSIFQSPRLQCIFTTRFALYLGDISYSLYIVHYYLTLCLSPWTFKLTEYLFGKTLERGHLGQSVAVVLEVSILLFVSIWQAHLYWKYVDKPCVWFSKWIERKAIM
jgi:peptidoglycan/LPS O-acetylase OafA/YrhL